MALFAPLPGEAPDLPWEPGDDPADPYGGYRLDGLYVHGPKGMRCPLAALIADSLLIVSGSTPENERRVRIRERAADLRRKYSIPELQSLEAARRQFRSGYSSGYGLYGRARKPANSGRKRRVA